MTFDLSRIDRITDYDEAINALEEYLEELVDEFVEAPEGKAYLAAYPEMAEFVGDGLINCFIWAIPINLRRCHG